MGKVGSVDSYEKVGNSEYKWFLQGCETRAIPITGPASQLIRCGQNFSEFVVPLAEKYYSLGDVCSFGNKSQARVTQEPYKSGANWCYTFQLMGSDANAFVDPVNLQIGKEVGFNYTAFEEGSEGGGSKTSTPMGFQNQMSIQRMSAGMTGSAQTSVIEFSFPGSKGKEKLWMYKQQYELMKQWHRTRENQIWRGVYNRQPDGTIAQTGANGRVVMTGSGIEEQITGSNTHIVSELTEDVIVEMLLSMNKYGKDGISNQKRMVITGLGGIWAFDKAMKKVLARTPGIGNFDSFFVERKGGNKLALGSQFITYRGLLGTEFTVAHHPFFDDQTVFPELSPGTPFTTKSFEMFFLDMSDYDGKPNIQMMSKGTGHNDRRMVQWFTAGGAHPSINVTSSKKEVDSMINAMRSNGYDGYQHYILSETMIIVRNPLSCGKIILTNPVYN